MTRMIYYNSYMTLILLSVLVASWKGVSHTQSCQMANVKVPNQRLEVIDGG